jgi:very-short-patch-repair endonuclease
MTPAEELLARVISNEFQHNYVIPTHQKRGSGYPTHYKADFANPTKMIVVEVDGNSHNSLIRQAQDKKKEAFLKGLGWTVLRVSNKTVFAMFGI